MFKNKSMKYLKLVLFSLIITCTFLFSCKKEVVNTNQKEFAVKNIDGKQVEYLEPSLLKSVRSNLIENKRTDDAKTLYEQYDSITGVLKGSNVTIPKRHVFNEKIDSSLIKVNRDTAELQMSTLKSTNIWEPHSVYAIGHVQSYGWVGQTFQSDYVNMVKGFDETFVGTTGWSLRLEAFKLFLQPQLQADPNEKPVLYYTVYTNEYKWYTPVTWGQQAGTTGRSISIMKMKMYFGSGYSNYHIYYKPHMQLNGWYSGWFYDGMVAGENVRLEAFAYYIFKY